jgi:hypothetical protein
MQAMQIACIPKSKNYKTEILKENVQTGGDRSRWDDNIQTVVLM